MGGNAGKFVRKGYEYFAGDGKGSTSSGEDGALAQSGFSFKATPFVLTRTR